MATSIKTPSSDLWLEGDTSLLEMQALMSSDSSESLQAAAGGKQPGGQAISSSFSNGQLSVTGNKSDNTIEISRNASGAILVNNGAVKTTGGTPTVANTSVIEVSGNGGNDVISLNESMGALPRANLYGGAGNDVLTGGSGNDQLFGQGDNDMLLGKGGDDALFGGDGNDVLTGGDGNDQMYGEAGDDRMIWNPGDDRDLMEGGSGVDTAEVNGGGGAEVFTVTANGERVRFDRLDPAPFDLDIGTTENLVVNMNAGNDQFSATGNLAALIKLTVDGGAGDDTILGSNGADLLMGGDGDDFIDGQQGNDTVFLGAGDDVFQWDPGDGSDLVEGQDGTDTMLFNGSNGAEVFNIAANGDRAKFTRDLGAIAMDLNDVERIDVNALGNTDTIVVGDLTGTDVTEVNVNLAGTLGGTAGDGLADTLITTGTGNGDIIDVFGSGTSVSVLGLSATVNVTNSEGALDSLVINGGMGNDGITATTMAAGITKLTLDGGAGNDTLLGSQGNDVLLGGEGNDFVLGDGGNDVAFLGAGDDVYQWDPGDGSDVVEGQDGMDTLLFNGSSASENITIYANGARAGLFRDVAGITMDLNGVEQIDYRALDGADNIVIGDMSGTDVTRVNLDLRGPNGGPDSSADSVTVNGTNGADVVAIAGDAGGVTVAGLQAHVNLFAMTPNNDRLTVNGLGGDDVLDATSLEADAVQLTLNGGLGNDVLLGSEGNDLFNGGDGNDVAIMGDGDDTFVWNPGDDNDTLEGQAGYDTLLFNGANVAENITISANGGRAVFFRDIASVTSDLNDVERIVYNAMGGADNVFIGDLSGTDVTEVNVNLAAVGGSGDGQVDTVSVEGTSGDDIITLSIRNGALVVDGLASQVVIEGYEAGDIIKINGLGGNDVIDASAIGPNGPALIFQGGDGDDILVGGDGADVLLGEAGNDVVLGGGGVDALDGGLGENVVIQDGSSSASGILSLSGGTADDALTLARDADGWILVNGMRQDATIANTGLLRVFGKEGNDTITLNETMGALPRAALYGGTGNDVLTGGSGNDQLFGQGDNDTLLGKGGFDFLYGGAGNDVLTGGDADDQMFGEAGDDLMVWNPGDDSDLMEGGSGIDTAAVNGGGGAEVFTVTANGARVRFDRLDPAPFDLDIGTTENLIVNMNGGNDSFSATGNLAALIKLTVDGGAGNDTILGSNGADLLMGGDGDDFIDGQQGNDTVFLGAGNDVLQWDPGDGSDVIEGQDGVDTMLFNGSNGAEVFNVSANGGRAKFTRDLGAIVMDLNDVERIDLNALGNTDTIVVGDLTGTDVTEVNVNLAGTLGGTAGDGLADTVIMNATSATGTGDVIDVFGSGTSVSVLGLSARVNLTNAEGGLDALVINGLDGNDSITATTVPVGVVKLTLDGGAGNDTLLGSQGNDVLLGGEGNDFVLGDGGNDVAFLGAGDDVYQWDPGDGSDVVEGQDGMDTLRFYGSSIGENIGLHANGGRATFTRDVAGVMMDLNDVEQIDLRAMGGADTVVIGDMGGTDVTRVDLDLRGSNGGPDGFVDSVTVNGTQGADTVSIWGDAGGVTVAGLQARVDLFATDSFDGLTVNGLGGNDVLDATSLEAGAVQLTLNGGLGDDILLGSEGGDLFNGGDGNDVAIMGAGDDTFVWNPGDDNDTLEGQAGYDALLFNGSNVAENVTISANGGRATFFRDIASVTTDLNDVERIVYNALGGADTVRVGDLSGTDVTRVDVNLAAFGGMGDGQADNVFVNGTSGDDVILLTGDSSGIAVLGLPAQVNVTGTEGTLDTITVYGHAGADVIDATGVAAGAVKLVLDGGDGDDVILGSAGDDVLIGGAGNDVLVGGGGNDLIIGGEGDDIEIQGFVAGAGTDDQIDLSDRGITFDWLMANAREVDGATVLELGDQQITLRGVTLDSLHQDDFLFG